MSKFIDAIESELLHERKPGPFPKLSVVDEQRKDEITMLTRYRIRVQVGIQGFCEPKDISHLRGNLVRSIREAIYGDIKDHMIRLEKSIYDQDREEQLSAIRDIMSEIFG